jgi:hypothetical protein
LLEPYVALGEREVPAVVVEVSREDASSYGRNVLNLVVCRRYLETLLDNAAVVRFLAKGYGELLGELQKIVETTSLEN